MSTYFATFQTASEAFKTVDELLRDGFQPESLSLIADFRRAPKRPNGAGKPERLGDASFFVGREDDPAPSEEADVRKLIGRVPHQMSDRMGGADTSETAFDVETIDESDESQELAEEEIYPFRGVSYGSREAAGRVPEMETNFPTRPDARDDVYDTETPLEDQNTLGFETMSLPDRGTVAGSGALAAVGLGLLDPTDVGAIEAIYRFLVDEGVPRPDAEQYRRAIVRGEALLAVEVVPGRTREGLMEKIIGRHLGEKAQLYDAHQFNEMGGAIREDVGGNS